MVLLAKSKVGARLGQTRKLDGSRLSLSIPQNVYQSGPGSKGYDRSAFVPHGVGSSNTELFEEVAGVGDFIPDRCPLKRAWSLGGAEVCVKVLLSKTFTNHTSPT
jgi:hypothetical protein